MVQNPLVYMVLYHPGGFPGGATGKRTRPPVQETRDAGSIPGSGRPSGEGVATQASTLTWRLLWTEEPGGLQSIWLHS